MSGKVAVERMLAYLPHIAGISLNSRRSLGHDLCSGKLRLGYAVIRYIGTPRESFTDSMAPKIDTEKLVTVTQAAKLLKITPAAIHKAIKRGRLPYIELGGVFLIQRPDLIKYNKSKSVGGRPKKQR